LWVVQCCVVWCCAVLCCAVLCSTGLCSHGDLPLLGVHTHGALLLSLTESAGRAFTRRMTTTEFMT